jgi:hypothetical protein
MNPLQKKTAPATKPERQRKTKPMLHITTQTGAAPVGAPSIATDVNATQSARGTTLYGITVRTTPEPEEPRLEYGPPAQAKKKWGNLR